MAITIDMVKNVLTNKYLTKTVSTVSVHSTKNHPANFHLSGSGSTRVLQVYNNSSIKLLLVPTSNCTQNISTHSTGSTIYSTSNGSIRIKLYVMDSSQNKYYLKINTAQNNAVELVCQSYVDSVSGNPFLRQELEFDLVPVDINDL